MAVRTLILAAATALAAGCGGGDPDGDGGSPAPRSTTQLTIEIRPSGPGGPFAEYTLLCDPAGGSLPNPEAVCAKLDELGTEVFAPVPDDVACTEQYGGPELATVSGKVDGEAISSRFTRTDGCQIGRWDRASFLLPKDTGT